MDLIAVAALTAILLPLGYALPLEPLRVPLGVLLVLFFPGYTLLAAMFPRRENLDGVERVALSIGLSLALVPLMGIALNFTPWGIRPTPIVLGLGLWTLAAAGAAWLRRWRVEPGERFEVRWGAVRGWASRQRRPADALVWLAVAAAAAAVVGGIAWRVENPPQERPFTEFYVLGAGGMLQDYPVRLLAGAGQEYNLGVVNHEQVPVTYSVRALIGGAEVGAVGGMRLEHGETWEGKIRVTPVALGRGLRLEFFLYRDPAPGPYMDLHLFVDVVAP